MIVGMDFGTTNSGMAVYNGRSVTVLPLDPDNANPRVIRTALYITNEQEIFVGRTAVNQYLDHHLGRPVRTKKVWIGEIEIFGGDMYYVTDAYSWVDVSSPGRLLLSVKTRLRDQDHPGTIVGQFFYALEDLVALYLQTTKVRAEKLLGQELKEVVLGRPVRFAADPEHDRLAQGRLLQAAFRAGYERVYFQYEPIAAAYSYETTLDKAQNVLVFDFGGGTLDLTVMRLGDPKTRQVLATGGIPIAGDVFDEMVVREKMPRHFGEGSLYGSRRKALTIPKWIYDNFSNWQTLLELQTAENRRMLREIAQTAQRRHEVEALLSLVSTNYGLKMYDVVEQAKRQLSEKRGAEIRLDGSDFKVHDFITRSEFERIIKRHIDAIERHLQETVAASGLRPEQIDVVIRTGGSSQIPVFDEMLRRHFGEEKVRSVDTFSSVTAGLGVIAHEIEQGTTTLPGHMPADLVAPPQAKGSRRNVAQANLDLLKLRVLMQEGVTTAVSARHEIGLVLVGEEKEISGRTVVLEETAVSLTDLNLPHPVARAITADLDEQLLLLTSYYRFLLITPRQLLELQTAGLQLRDMHPLEGRESLCGIVRWNEIKQHDKFLLVTSLGLARSYPMTVMRDSIEAPVPFRFENPLPGWPNLILGGNSDDEMVVATDGGRATRLPLASVGVRGMQVLNCGMGTERMQTAVLTHPDQEITLITADGYGRKLRAGWVPPLEKPNQKGKSLIARRSPLVAMQMGDEPFWLVTNRRLVRGENGRLSPDESSKTQPLLKLETDEQIIGLLP
ncbi:MAG: Hsp70 family protein [Ardenticatenaceae bacterium]|nr:Hsp70 family protein [Ardenticatenaceae bacterium]